MAYRRTAAVTARLAASRTAILDAAVALLAEHGYAACSIAAVAARAGVATGSVYRHFPSKSDLVTEVFRVTAGREVTAVATVASAPGPVRERVTAVIETFAGRAAAAPRLAYALLAEPVDPAVDAERLVFRRAFRTVVADLIADGVAHGELPGQDHELAAAAIVGAVGEALVAPLAAGATRPTGITETIRSLVTFTLRALGGTDAGNP